MDVAAPAFACPATPPVKNHPAPLPLAHPGPRRRGFALLITITLLAFLVLLLVSLASLTRVETRVAGNNQQLAQARQNALMALNLALGQLQKHTGPDRRVTATADLRPLATGATADPVSGQSLNTGATSAILAGVDNYWRGDPANGARNRRWVGAWLDSTPAANSPAPQLQSWLVSGNENVPAAYLPETRVANFTFAGVTASGAATANYGTAAAPYRLLVGPGTVRISADTDLDRAVVAPAVTINSDAVPGFSSSQTVGRYAWWIGDEGLKARADLIDSRAGSVDPAARRLRLQSAARPLIEAMTGLASLYPSNHPGLAKLVSSGQFALVNSDPAFRVELANRYHDVTVSSRGVLADVRHGGLKADLSWMLGQTSTTDFRDNLRDLYADNAVTANDPILSPSFSPHVPAPGTGIFINNFQLGLARTATWAQLRSHFNFGSSPSATPAGIIDGGRARARIQRVDTQGAGPLLVHAKLFFGLQVDAGGAIHLRLRPLVVLANPYNIPMTGDFWVRFNRPVVELRTGTFTPASPPPVAPTQSDLALFPTNYPVTYRNRMNLVLQSVIIPPGEARVYCLDQDYTDPGSGPVQQIKMVEGYDEAPVFTLASGRSLGTATHAAIYVGSGGNPDAWLYAADPAANNGNEDNLIQYVFGRPLNQTGVGGNFFMVHPTPAGATTAGGGCWLLTYDSITTIPGTSQQANFLQFNPRALAVFWTGGSSNTHPLENTQSYQRNGSPGNASWFTADLMFDTAAGDRVRWGPVNKAGPGSPPTNAPAGVSADTGFVNILYDVPRPEHPVSSIAQLQHFSPSGFISNGRFGNTTPEQFATQANTFQLNYPVGNSYPNPRVPRDQAVYAFTSSSGTTNMGTAYDGSWLYNDVLADRFHFSTYPASGNFDFAANPLVNPRLRPFRNTSVVPWNQPAGFRGAPRTAATNLLSDGSFNINSTSREAWRAVLSGLRGVPVSGDTTARTPFSRTLFPTSGHTSARNANSAAAWAGFHNLSDTEIDDLAGELVLQIRRRGPFLSLADFMNRRLVAASSDPMGNGLVGALQAAIDAILNGRSGVDPVFQLQSATNNFADAAYRARTLSAGSPGYVLQADLLSPLGPGLAARSDTFTIRTCGEVLTPATGEITARAWCEAVVQRLPDYIVPASAGGNAPAEIPAAGSVNATFGRRYEIVSFRWLSPADI